MTEGEGNPEQEYEQLRDAVGEPTLARLTSDLQELKAKAEKAFGASIPEQA